MTQAASQKQGGAQAQSVIRGSLWLRVLDPGERTLALLLLAPTALLLALIIVFPQVPLFLPRLFPPGTL